jgi:hypothetical protein
MSSFKLRKENDCLNCGHTVEKHFCPECGQENIEVKEDAFHMVVHAVADYFHFEHKFFGTIKPLLLKPGKLTQAYVSGKRVSFIHPIRLYIFISIVFFLVVLSGETKKNELPKVSDKEVAAKKLTRKQLKKLEDIKIAMRYMPGDAKKKDSILKVAEMDLKKYGYSNINLYTGERNTKNNSFFSKFLKKDSTLAQYDKRQAALPKAQKDGFLKHYIVKRTLELSKYPDPEQKFLEGLMHNIPKMMFFILPIFAMILKLVYIRKNRYYYEHLIYSFHVHSAFFLGFLLVKLLSWLSGFVYDIGDWLIFFYLIYMVWYIYRSLRTFYGSTRWITVLKLFFLFICYNIVLTLGFLLIIAVSFAFV